MTTKIFTTKGVVELAKRVPPNQVKQFEEFRKKTLEYYRKVNSLPDKLPTIDWEFYRGHVRDGYVKMVEQFQIKYKELDHSFAKRHEVLDHSKYYTEWEELEAQVRAEVKEFIEASADRVKIYEEELRRLKNLNYENMTMEEFIEAREDIAHMIPGQGKPLFWPHTPEEQIVLNNENADEKMDDVNGKEEVGNKNDSVKLGKDEVKKET